MAIGHIDQRMWKDALTDSSTTAIYDLGTIREEINSDVGLKKYRYVQAAADTTVANGTCLTFTDLYRRTASSDISDGDVNQGCGVGIGAIAASSYGWVQCYGYHSAVITNGDDDIADGDSVILGADGVCDSVASGTAPTSKPLGYAVDADVDGSNTVETFLDCV